MSPTEPAAPHRLWALPAAVLPAFALAGLLLGTGAATTPSHLPGTQVVDITVTAGR